jgi:hypothetical protein
MFHIQNISYAECVLGYNLGNREMGLDFVVGQRFFSFLQHLDWLLSPTKLPV